jgi:hypothetical protein
MKEFLEKLQEAEKEIKSIDHLIYIAFPLVKEKSIITKSLLNLKKAIGNCINLILQYEYVHKRIELSADPKENFFLFKESCSKRYLITLEEIKEIEQLFDLARSHKYSPMEFMKDGKVIILSDNMLKRTISLEDLKKFLEISKEVVKKIKNEFKKEILDLRKV